MVEDMVVGVVVEKHAENYRVDINSTQPARLPALAFEGASKRNKPNIQVPASALPWNLALAHQILIHCCCCDDGMVSGWCVGVLPCSDGK